MYLSTWVAKIKTKYGKAFSFCVLESLFAYLVICIKIKEPTSNRYWENSNRFLFDAVTRKGNVCPTMLLGIFNGRGLNPNSLLSIFATYI